MSESAPRRRAIAAPATSGPNVTAFRTVGVSERPSLNTPYVGDRQAPSGDCLAIRDRIAALSARSTWAPRPSLRARHELIAAAKGIRIQAETRRMALSP